MLFAVLCLCFLVMLCSCGSQNPPDTPEPTGPARPTPYSEILSDFEKLVEFRLLDDFEQNWNDRKRDIPDWMQQSDAQWSDMIVEMCSGLTEPKKSSFGYVFQDLNDDSTPELFWVRKDGMILAVFTIREQQPVLLDAFWPRYDCVITKDRELYTRISGGAACTSYTLRTLGKDGTLSTIKQFGEDGFTDKNTVRYFEQIGTQKKVIDNARFEELMEEYPFAFSARWSTLPITYLSV